MKKLFTTTLMMIASVIAFGQSFTINALGLESPIKDGATITCGYTLAGGGAIYTWNPELTVTANTNVSMIATASGHAVDGINAQFCGFDGQCKILNDDIAVTKAKTFSAGQTEKLEIDIAMAFAPLSENLPVKVEIMTGTEVIKFSILFSTQPQFNDDICYLDTPIGVWSGAYDDGFSYNSMAGLLYEVTSRNLEIPQREGVVNHIKSVCVDGISIKKWWPLDISQYLDGKVHTIQIYESSYYAPQVMNFVYNPTGLLGYDEKILYSINDNRACVCGYLFGLENAVISESISYGGIECSVTGIYDCAFNSSLFKYDDNLSSITVPKTISKIGAAPFDSKSVKDLTILCNANCGYSIPKSVTLHTFPKNIKAYYLNLDKSIKIEPLRDIEITDEVATLDYISFKIKNDIGANIHRFAQEDNGIMTVSNGNYVVNTICLGQENSWWLSYEHPDYGTLNWTIRIMAPSPLSVVECKRTTQSTATFHVNTYQNDSRIGKPYVLYKDMTFYCDNNGDLTVSGLDSNTSDWQEIRVQFKENEYTSSCAYQTLPMNPDVIAEVGPTTISVTPTYDKIDGIIKSSSLTINGQEYPGKAQTIGGLTPGLSVSVVYSLNNEEVRKSFELPELVLTTLPARATSKDCAIICAETNMSEDEIGGGFEWRRYDAPDMVPSNSVACPVANGHMEGRLNGLSSGTYYKYRPFYEDATGQKTYGEWTAFGTADVDVYFVPTVYTYTARSVGSTSATLVGYALAGSEDVTEQGFEYWPEITPRAATTEVKRVLATGQRMMATIDDLEPGMTYNVRAFATTKTETTYGEMQQFETEAIDDPIEDSIEEVETVEPSGQFDIYTVTGVCVRRNATDFSGLRSGIYIANGRKIMVR